MSSDEATSVEARFANGDKQAIREIHDVYAGRMFAVAYRILADRGLAADAVQQALLQVWRAADKYDPTRPIEPWLFVITRRAAVDIYRRNKNHGSAVDIDASHLEAIPAPEQQTMEQTWTIWRVRTAIEGMRESDRVIIKLAYYDGLTHTEISDKLDIPIGTVKSRLFRAQQKLSAALPDLRDTPLPTNARMP